MPVLCALRSRTQKHSITNSITIARECAIANHHPPLLVHRSIVKVRAHARARVFGGIARAHKVHCSSEMLANVFWLRSAVLHQRFTVIVIQVSGSDGFLA